MSKFNNRGVRSAVSSPVTTTAPAFTALGGHGFTRDERSELFLLAITNLVSEETFHEKASSRDERFNHLVRRLAVEDFEWLTNMLSWLRHGANLRSASLVGAAVAVHQRVSKGLHEGNADLILRTMGRADEPGEFLAFWRSEFGRALPKSVKKGVASAAVALYNERSYLKWDSDARGYRMADVVETVCPTPENDWQNALFRHMLDERHHKDGSVEGLSVIRNQREWRASAADVPKDASRKYMDTVALLDPEVIKAAGLTWEDVLSLLGSKVDKKLLWEAVIPSMGIMALIRNLRNFDEAGVSDSVAEKFVISRLSDSEQIRRSGLLPMQIHSAYRAAPSLRWSWPLEKALNKSLENVPELKGRTLVLVDTSSSMNDSFSKDGSVKRWDAAVLFGVALAKRCAQADLVSFSSAQYYWNDPKGAKTKQFGLVGGEGLLTAIERWSRDGFFLGGGTDTAGAVRQHFQGHDRIVILTDEQAGHDPQTVSDAAPKSVPMYTWNLAGYKVGHGESGVKNRYTYGGLTDAAFRQIGRIEAGVNGRWPWEE